MRLPRLVYIGSVLIVGWGGTLAAFTLDNNGILDLIIIPLIMAIVSYPLGSIATLLQMPLLLIGFMNPAETLFLATPIYAALGYLQWYRLFPRIYREKPSNVRASSVPRNTAGIDEP